MANSTGPCETDLDCAEFEFCYRNVSWAPDRTFCSCSTFWGWEGDECSSFGVNTYFLIIEPAVVIAICSVVLVLATLNCVTLVRDMKPTKDLLSSFAVVYVAIVFTLAWNISIILSATSPNRIITELLTSPGQEISTADPTEKKFVFFEEFEALFQTAVYFFSFLSLTSVSIVWMSVVEGVKSLKVGNQVPKMKWAVRLFQIAFVIFVIVAYSVGAQTLAIGILLVAVLLSVTAVVYTVALSKLVSVLAAFPTSRETYGGLIRRLRINARNVIASITLSVILLITYSIFQLTGGWKTYSPEGQLSAHAVVRQLGFFCLLIANLQIYCYLRSIIVRKGRQSSVRGPTYVSNGSMQSFKQDPNL